MDYKETIIQALDVLRKRDLADKQPFSARAYATVIQQLKQYDGPITSYEQVGSMKGVGEKIQKKIKEIIETGHLRSADRAMEAKLVIVSPPASGDSPRTAASPGVKSAASAQRS